MGPICDHILKFLTTSRRRISTLGAVLVCLLPWGPLHAQLPAPQEIDQPEGRFLQQLVQRRLYRLAEDYCQQRVRQRSLPASQAWWLGQQLRVTQQHVWQESAANRLALTQDSIRQVADFLNAQSVAPEYEIWLRCGQVDGLLNLAWGRFHLWNATRSGPDTDRAPSQAEPESITGLLDQAAPVAAGLQKQLDQARRQIPSRQLSALREHLRLLSAQLLTLRWLTGDRAVQDYQPTVRAQLQLDRSARRPTTRWQAIRNLTLLQLAAGDRDGLNLTRRKLSAGPTEDQRALAVRILLKQGQATEALQLCRRTEAESKTGTELGTLEQEALLQLLAAAEQLQDQALRESTRLQMDQAVQTTRDWPSSLWADVSRQIVQRFRLVESAGLSAANVLEQADLLQAAGKKQQAMQELKRVLKLLPASSGQRTRAAIHQRLGQMLIEEQQWQDAIDHLQIAQREFSSSDLIAQAADADLLQVWCRGQLWRQFPSNPEHQQGYRESLQQHRQHWPGQAARATATDWLIRLEQRSNPVLAAGLMQEQVDAASTPMEKQQRLLQLGEFLEQLPEQSPADNPSPQRSTDGHQSVADLRAAFHQHCQDLIPEDADLTNTTAQLVLLQQNLLIDGGTSWEEWQTLSDRLPRLEQALVNPSASVLARLRELQLVATARTTTDAERLQAARQALLDTKPPDQLAVARRLALFLPNSGLVKTGDGLLARTIESLLRQQIPQTDQADDLATMLAITPSIIRLTGRYELQTELLQRLQQLPLSSAQVRRVAETLQRSSGSLTDESATVLASFWKQTRASSQEGSDLWLEATLQLAELAEQRHQTMQAIRHLKVTSALYPDWGAPERAQRAARLQQRLEQAEQKP